MGATLLAMRDISVVEPTAATPVVSRKLLRRIFNKSVGRSSNANSVANFIMQGINRSYCSTGVTSMNEFSNLLNTKECSVLPQPRFIVRNQQMLGRCVLVNLGEPPNWLFENIVGQIVVDGGHFADQNIAAFAPELVPISGM